MLNGDADGAGGLVYSQAAADRTVRSDGWMIRRNGTVLCPDCSGRNHP